MDKQLTIRIKDDKIYIAEKGKVTAVYQNGEPSDVGFAIQKYLEDNPEIVKIKLSSKNATTLQNETRILVVDKKEKLKHILDYHNLNYYSLYLIELMKKKYVVKLLKKEESEDMAVIDFTVQKEV